MEAKRLISDILIRIRLLSVKQKEPYSLFHSILGFYPQRVELYQQALRHRSQSVRSENGMLVNNERLEFLGDAVLNVLVADILFKHFNTKNEDFLTKTRSKIVQRNSLNKIALELGLDKLIVTSTPNEQPHHSIYGNALEALIGAIYLDQGYRRCKRFLEKKILERYIDMERIASTDTNFKSILLEWGQQEKVSVEFDTEELQKQSEKSAHFKTVTLINNITFGEGEGLSKKEAQQLAAKRTLEQIKKYPGNFPDLFKKPEPVEELAAEPSEPDSAQLTGNKTVSEKTAEEASF
jgi:ribonuclease III